MKIRILTICPEQFASFLKTPLISRCIRNGLLDLQIIDIRDFAPGSFRRIDDSPYGGGAGMILKCQPVLDALRFVRTPSSKTILLAPIGKTYTQKDAHRLVREEELLILCGHFEGFDARIHDEADEIISIGDYVLCGGELPAMVICESLMRLVDGSMKKESVSDESFEDGLLEYPQYTRPEEYAGKKVPPVLLSGDHERIRNWRLEESLKLTREKRPDLYETYLRKQEGNGHEE